MSAPSAAKLLSLSLTLFGLIFLFGIYPLTIIWPSGWSWEPAQPAYLQMILGIYATLGVFLLRAAKDPGRHLSLIWFTIWSSLVHAGIMAWHAFTDAGEMGHMLGDVAALALVGVVLALLVSRAEPASRMA